METATMMTEEPEEDRSSPVNDANSPPSSESPAPDITTTETAKEASLQVIKRKLSAAGLIDIEVCMDRYSKSIYDSWLFHGCFTS